MILIYENFLEKHYVDKLEEDAVNNILYFYNKHTAYLNDIEYKNDIILGDKNIIDCGQLVGVVFNKKRMTPNIHYLPHLYDFLNIIHDKVDVIDKDKLDRIKFNILIKNIQYKNNNYNVPHVDGLSKISILYYVNDSDGDTFFFNKIQSKDSSYEPNDKLEIIKRVAPKKNTLVVFDASIYHASSNPTTHNERVVINMTFLK
jgi:hypothetical protein